MNAAFADIARKDPERVRTVRSDGRKSRTAAAVFAQLADLFPWMADIEREDPGFFGRLDARRSRPGRSRAARKGE